MQPAQFSKCKSGIAHFPPNKLRKLMDICGNRIPLRWLALHEGFELRPLLSTIEQELAAERKTNEELKTKLATIEEFMRRTRA